MNDFNIWLTVAVIAFVTAITRFLPFLVWNGKKKTPNIIVKLGKVLPYSIMGMLVVYCLKDVSFMSMSGFAPQLISCLVVAVLYVWKRNTLVSIVAGTLANMILVQMVF